MRAVAVRQLRYQSATDRASKSASEDKGAPHLTDQFIKQVVVKDYSLANTSTLDVSSMKSIAE
jgi:hypothetical protein